MVTQALIPLAISAASALAGSMLNGGGGGEGGGGYNRIELPDFYEDPYYGASQDTLFPIGKRLLDGDIPEYYKPIGEYGGSIFETFMQGVTADAQRGVEETMAAKGTLRGGRATAAVGKAISDVSSKYRYADYLRALEGRQFFMNSGREIVEGVRSGALSNQGQFNEFNISKAALAIEQEANAAKYPGAPDQTTSLWKQLLSTGLSAAGSVIGAQYGSAKTSNAASQQAIANVLGTRDNGQPIVVSDPTQRS